MKTQTQELCVLLERMVPLYERVYDVLSRERDALVQLDYESIYTLLAEKDEVIAVIRSIDSKRLILQDSLSAELGFEPSDTNISMIAKAVSKDSPKLAEKLLSLRSQVNRIIEATVDRISVNKNLIERSVGNLQDIAQNLSRAINGILEEVNKEHKTYSSKAKYSDKKQGSGSILRKQL